MGGMIGDLIARGERIRDNPSLKDDHGWSKCQGFQLIRVFGTDRAMHHEGIVKSDTPGKAGGSMRGTASKAVGYC